MTEAEWLTSDDPRPMLTFLLGEAVVHHFPHCRGSDRRRRLLLCAYCRDVGPDLKLSDSFHSAVEATERYLDGAAADEVIAASARLAVEESEALTALTPAATARLGWGGLFARFVRLVAGSPAFPSPPDTAGRPWDGIRRYSALRLGVLASQLDWVDSSIHGLSWAAGTHQYGLAEEERRARNARLATACRDVFGNPFRPLAADPAWLTSDVLALARGIYADRAFDRMPILADALQDAGCDSDDVLGHCRGGAPHVKGCWVVDMLLGKE